MAKEKPIMNVVFVGHVDHLHVGLEDDTVEMGINHNYSTIQDVGVCGQERIWLA